MTAQNSLHYIKTYIQPSAKKSCTKHSKGGMTKCTDYTKIANWHWIYLTRLFFLGIIPNNGRYTYKNEHVSIHESNTNFRSIKIKIITGLKQERSEALDRSIRAWTDCFSLPHRDTPINHLESSLVKVAAS